MSGTIDVRASEASGTVALPADLDKLAVVIGPSSNAYSGLSPFFVSGLQAQATIGYGDAPDACTSIIEQVQAGAGSAAVGNKIPAAFCGVPGTTPGAYGTLNTSGVTGSAIFTTDATVLPFGTYSARLVCTTSGSVGGYPAPLVSWMLGHYPDDIAHLSTPVALNAASFTIPNSGFKVNIGVAVTGTTDATSGALYNNMGSGLDTLTLILTVNGVGPTTLTLAYNTNAASEAAFLAAIHAEWSDITATVVATHLVLTTKNGSIIVGAGTANTALGLTPGTYAPTLIAGDVLMCRTLAPAPQAADLAAAFTTLVASTANFSLIVLPFPLSPSMLPTITAGLNALRDQKGKRPNVLARTRLPQFDLNLAVSGVTNANPAVITVASTAALTSGYYYTLAGTGLTNLNGTFPVTVINGTTFSVPVAAGGAWSAGGTVVEDDNAWTLNTQIDWTLTQGSPPVDSRVHVRGTYCLTQDALTGRTYQRSDLAQFAADVVRVERSTWPDAPADQPMANCSFVDGAGVLVGHDEGPANVLGGGILSNDQEGMRLGCQQRIPGNEAAEAVFATSPWMLYGIAIDNTIPHLMAARIARAMERVAVAAALKPSGASTPTAGSKLFYVPANPSASPPTQASLTQTSIGALHGTIFDALSGAFADDIQNANDGDLNTGLVQVVSTVVVNGGFLAITVNLLPLMFGYVRAIGLVLYVQGTQV
jgi:hypothetical protein